MRGGTVFSRRCRWIGRDMVLKHSFTSLFAALGTAVGVSTTTMAQTGAQDVYNPAPFSERVEEFTRLFALSCIATDGDPSAIEPLSDEGAAWESAIEIDGEDAFLNSERQSWGMPAENPIYVLAFGPSEDEGKEELECSLATPGYATGPHDAKSEIESLLGVMAAQYVVQRTESVMLRGPGFEEGRVTDDATVVLTDLEAPGRGDQKLEHSWSGGWHVLTLYRPVRKGWWWE